MMSKSNDGRDMSKTQNEPEVSPEDVKHPVKRLASCPLCAIKWEDDMDEFGCWVCGYDILTGKPHKYTASMKDSVDLTGPQRERPLK